MREHEVNFDGLVGPSHNYAGLSAGNLASGKHGGQISSPKRAAQQGLLKMRALAERGVVQCVLPPQPRPRLDLLRALGWEKETWRAAPQELLARVFSASSMWAANAATVVPSRDSHDGRVHLVVANLSDRLHRSIEPAHTEFVLRQIFNNAQHFAVHQALPFSQLYGDEGAANHTRLAFAEQVLHLFVYGREDAARTSFPARQSRLASEAVARVGKLRAPSLYLQQATRAIEAGVFHNDVISVGHGQSLVLHEAAFDDETALALIRERFPELRYDVVSESELPLAEAVRSYLFNSQIVTTDSGRNVIYCPAESDTDAIRQILHRWQRKGIIDEFVFLDLRESMKNGGGPACLRLRVWLTQEELAALAGNVLWNDALHTDLWEWSESLRDEVSPADLRDADFREHCLRRTREVYALLGLSCPDTELQ